LQQRQHLEIATEGGVDDIRRRPRSPLSLLVAAVIVALLPPCRCWQVAAVTRPQLTVHLPPFCCYVGPGGRQRQGWWSMGATFWARRWLMAANSGGVADKCCGGQRPGGILRDVFSEKTFMCFLCPRCTIKSVFLSVEISPKRTILYCIATCSRSNSFF
jgi:hypothetical protein